MTLDRSRHPCFAAGARHNFGRVHLPVAPKCNVQCNFCSRAFDCVNESRPGVTSRLLTPHQALAYLHRVVELRPETAVAGIAGPGDAFANPVETMTTLELVRRDFPEMLLCLASNGLCVTDYVADLARLDVSHVTITINAVDPEIGKDIYAWIRPGKRPMRGVQGARELLERQLSAVRALKDHGITVKVNTILIHGINVDHAPEIARTMADLGVDVLNCIPVYPVEGTPFGSLPTLSDETVAEVRGLAMTYLPQMHHCTRCRADAVGLLGEDTSELLADALSESAALPADGSTDRRYVAVGTREGILLNQHLGEAEELLILDVDDAGECTVIDRRHTPPPNGGPVRWEALAAMLKDCRAVLVSGAGPSPTAALRQAGLEIVVAEGLIDEIAPAVHAGRPVRSPIRAGVCGIGCSGRGTGCG